MEKRPTEPKEEYETASYYLPRRLIEAVGIYYVTGRFTSKSAALADLIARGLQAGEATKGAAPVHQEAQVPA